MSDELIARLQDRYDYRRDGWRDAGDAAAALALRDAEVAALAERCAEMERENESCLALLDIYNDTNISIQRAGEIVWREIEAVRAVVALFLAKYDECKPHLDGLHVFAHVHGQKYDGPNWGKEIAALRALAPRAPAEDGEPT